MGDLFARLAERLFTTSGIVAEAFMIFSGYLVWKEDRKDRQLQKMTDRTISAIGTVADVMASLDRNMVEQRMRDENLKQLLTVVVSMSGRKS